MAKEKIIELRPIKESSADFDQLEKRIKELFKREIYLPLLKEFYEPRAILKNEAGDDSAALRDALLSGRVTFSLGVFSGKFSAAISRELRKLGAKWDRKRATFRILKDDLPREVQETISGSDWKFQEKIDRIDKRLSEIAPEALADKLKSADLFDRTLWKTDDDFKSSVKGIAIAPTLTRDQRKKIADEWQNNMKLYIKDFTQKQIKTLRADMKASVFAGGRFESAVSSIQKSYGVSARKAKFLARQETNLLMAKFKETRYTAAGVNEYKWRAVAGSPAHPVRPRHRDLSNESQKGKIFRWDQPPITTPPGEPERRNNPGQDYNCRCTAVPVVRFGAKK